MNEEKIIREIEQLKNEIAGLKEQQGIKTYLKKAFSKTHVLVGIGCTILATSLIVYAAQITFTDGEVISAEQVNANFTELYDNVTALLTKTGQHDTAIANAASVRDISRNLLIFNTDGDSAYQMDITADEIILQDTDFNPKRATNIDLRADITASGANGLDTGSEAASTWYYIWVISGDSGDASLLSTSSTAPVLPSAYSYMALAGAIYNNASSDFIRIYQIDKKVMRIDSSTINTAAENAWTAMNLSAIVPETAKIAKGRAYTPGPYVSFSSSSSGFVHLNIEYNWGTFSCPMIEKQKVYYFVPPGGGGGGQIVVNGWEY